VVDIILKCVTIWSVMVGAIAVYIALRNNSRQLGAQIFLNYSDRIHKLRQTIPLDVDVSKPLDDIREPSHDVRRAISAMYYLIFEFYSLRKHGYVANAIWAIWELDIVRLLNTMAFREEWASIRQHFEIHPDFVRWVCRWQEGS
jgi:hypothetical protein